MYEHHSHPLLTRTQYMRRILSHLGVSGILVAASLGVGTMGYHWLAQKSWIDSFLNASMLLGGMGPVGDIDSVAGKLFASFYALYAGLVFILAGGIVFAPTLHRILHSLHVVVDDEEVDPKDAAAPRET